MTLPPPTEPDGAHGDHANARKLTIYFGERTRDRSGRFAAESLLDLCGEHKIASSILLRGIEGFGIRHHLRTDRSLSLSEDPPLVAVAVDETERVERLLADVERLGIRGLTTVERARLVNGTPVRNPLLDATANRPASASKLTVYVGRQRRHGGRPTHLAVVDVMHRRGLAGASVFPGVDGTARGMRQRARFFDRNPDVPAMIIAVGDDDRIAGAIDELRGLLESPLFTIERCTVCKRDGVLLGWPQEPARADEDGLAWWRKIMVFTSEATLHDGAPIHRALIRRLRSERLVRGATTIRGVWGFHGDHPPHGDKLLQIHRRVPVATIMVDRPDHAADALAGIDHITAQHGLVTSEMVPALASVQPGGRSGGLHLARG